MLLAVATVFLAGGKLTLQQAEPLSAHFSDYNSPNNNHHLSPTLPAIGTVVFRLRRAQRVALLDEAGASDAQSPTKLHELDGL